MGQLPIVKSERANKNVNQSSIGNKWSNMVENGQNELKVMSPQNKEKIVPGTGKPLVKCEC